MTANKYGAYIPSLGCLKIFMITNNPAVDILLYLSWHTYVIISLEASPTHGTARSKVV